MRKAQVHIGKLLKLYFNLLKRIYCGITKKIHAFWFVKRDLSCPPDRYIGLFHQKIIFLYF